MSMTSLRILIRPYNKSFHYLYLLLLAAVMLVASTCAHAESGSLSLNSARYTGERPNANGPPTEVSLGLFIIDIDAINDAAQQFNVDMFLNVKWQDPRLALPEGQRKGLIRTVPLADIWWPRGFVLNERGIQRKLTLTAEIDDAGNVRHQQRIIGPLSVDLAFKDFPFDKQILPISLVTYANSTEKVRFVHDAETTGADDVFSIEGWELELIEPVLSEFEMPGVSIPRSKITFRVAADRVDRYHLITLFLPMTLIILMAWSVFWVQPDIIPPRISIATAAIFSFVAFGFSIRSRLPEVSYMTKADVFVTGCTLLVFLALAVAVAGSRLANSERMDQALQLSALARWVYPLLYLITVWFSYTY
ncbi:MAG: hypothetical protein ACR2QG_02070 [Gammaproteobacteria bacterium]